MGTDIVNEFIQAAVSNINIITVVFLMAIGFIVKHVKYLDKVSNDIIPIILLLCSIAITLVQYGCSTESIIGAIISAAVAIGLHQTGKNIFTVTIIPSITKKFSNSENEKTDEDNKN